MRKKFKKSILFVSDYVGVGGSNTFLNDLSYECAKHNICFSSLLFTGSKSNKYITAEFLIVPGYGYFYTFHRIIALYRKFHLLTKPNTVIVCDLFFPALSLLLLAKTFKIPNKIFYQFHGFDSYEAMSKKAQKLHRASFARSVIWFTKHQIEKWILKNVYQVICFSNYSKILIQKEVGYKIGVKVIKPGYSRFFDTPKISKSRARDLLGISIASKVILYVGRIEPRKGVFGFFQHLDKIGVLEEGLTILFLSSYTDDGYASDLFELTRKKKYVKSIRFINDPPRKDLPLFFYASDLMILPSIEFETFGLVTLEAIACDLPTVGFNIGANKDLIHQSLLVKKSAGMAGFMRKIDFYFSLESSKVKKIISENKKNIEEYSYEKYIDHLMK